MYPKKNIPIKVIDITAGKGNDHPGTKPVKIKAVIYLHSFHNNYFLYF